MSAIGSEISGRVWLLGDNVNTDILHPPSCFSLDEKKMRDGIFVGMETIRGEGKDTLLGHQLIIVAGENFGCGSSRETSVRALSSLGVRAIVASSFARIFFRSLVNRGIAPIECKGIQDKVSEGDTIIISIAEQQVILADNRHIPFAPFDPHVKKILEAGGLISYLKMEGL